MANRADDRFYFMQETRPDPIGFLGGQNTRPDPIGFVFKSFDCLANA
ncbi:MAG: hypothetical protein ACJAZP_001879 [Psychromonas sp.]|jgi:hypothetical protein